MTVTESYLIHRCIFRNDSAALKELMNDEKMQQKINECDNHGNSPLHLALMLNRHNCINVLLQYNCDVFSRNSLGWNPMEEASMLGDIDVIEKMSLKKWMDYLNIFIKEGGLLEQWNSTTPNLYLKCKLKLKTTIPLLQKFGAKDVQQLYKKGSNIRLDTTLAGVDTRGIPKLIRGKISVLFKYGDSNTSKIYLLDHKKKIYQEFFPNVPEWYLSNSLKSKVGTNILYKFYYDLTKFNVKLMKGNILKKNTKTFTMEDGNTYKCSHYRAKNFTIITKRRNDEGLVGECESIINKDIKEEDLSKVKKSKEGKFGKSSNTSKLSNDSDDESDSDSAYDDSEDESDTESKVSSIDKPIPGFLGDLYENDKKKQDPNKTVTYTINKDGETKTFEKATTMDDTLDWEEAYREKYAKNADIMYNFINGKNDNAKIKRLNHMEIQKLNLKTVTEEEYFDPSSTNSLHLGRIMDINEIKKAYKHKIKFWMAKENSGFPVSAYDVKPIFEFALMFILDQIKTDEKTNQYDKHAYEYISKTLLNMVQEKHSFPVKTSVPIYPSIAFQATFLNASKDTKYLPDELFEIPDDYNVGNVFFEYIHK